MVFFFVDKGILIALATLFTMALASKDGNVPDDPVFECLSELSEEAYLCYVSNLKFCLTSRENLRLIHTTQATFLFTSFPRFT